jgi:hypothetical protein
MAGAQIPLDGVERDAGKEVRRRFLAELGKDPEAAPQALIRDQADD